jgi:hypothetical protein
LKISNRKPSNLGVKYDDGKLRFDLIPVTPLKELARVYTIGSVKYDDRNWEKGLSWGRVFAAMMRHGWTWWKGEKFDKVDGQHHLASVVWCAFALMEYENTRRSFDDRPPAIPPKSLSHGTKKLTKSKRWRGKAFSGQISRTSQIAHKGT